MWSVDPGIGEFVRRADHEGCCHIASGPLGSDGAPKNLARDHLHAGSHQSHEYWSGKLPGLVGVGSKVSAPVAGPVDMADTTCW